MSDTAASTASAIETTRDPADRAAVEVAMRAFAKAWRATLLYMPNNAMRLGAVDGARAAFAAIWDHLDRLLLDVRDTSLEWEGGTVLDDRERGMDGLPWLLYRDGLRRVQLSPGFETASLDALLGILQRARTTSPDDDDLVTLLWVADLEGVQYRHAESDTGAPSGEIGERGGDDAPTGARIAGAILAESETALELSDAAVPAVIRMDDFDATLHFLDRAEIELVRRALAEEYAEDPRRKVVRSLFDIVAMPVARADRLDALTSLEDTLVDLLAGSDLALVALFMEEAAATRELVSDDPELVTALDAFPARVSEPTVVTQLLVALDDGARAPSPAALQSLFALLRPEALLSVLAWLGGTAPSPTQEVVQEAAMRLAAANTSELARAIEGGEPSVVRGALPIAAQLATPAVVPALARLLPRGDAALRAEIIAALRQIGTTGALQAVEPSLDDTDRDVRLAACRAIADRRHVGALPRLRLALRRREARSADLSEKMALFEAFGAVCGDAGVAELDELLNARGLLGAREPVETRACAARALGLIGTTTARAALRRAAETKESVVRSAVARALRGETDSGRTTAPGGTT